jgi:hypothetical protein
MRVACRVVFTRVPGDEVPEVDGVEVVCGRCRKRSQALGESEWSVRAALVKLRDKCPKKESNFYADEEEEVDTSTHVKGPIQP